jgi:hypothetical protein
MRELIAPIASIMLAVSTCISALIVDCDAVAAAFMATDAPTGAFKGVIARGDIVPPTAMLLMLAAAAARDAENLLAGAML